MLIVLTTFPDHASAEALATRLVESKLAGCVQILPQMTSVYRWQGAVQRDPEHLVLIKTLPEKWNELREFITANHSYEVPEIVAISAENVSEQYLLWLSDAIG